MFHHVMILHHGIVVHHLVIVHHAVVLCGRAGRKGQNKERSLKIGKDKELEFAIKGDAKQEYPQIKKIMDILQDQKINSFNLVTGSRGKDY